MDKKGKKWGLIAASAILIIFIIMNFINNKDVSHLVSIHFAYIGFRYLGKYSVNKEKSVLVSAILGVLGCIASLILAVMVNDYAKEGWRLMQVLTPSTVGYGTIDYYEFVFERKI